MGFEPTKTASLKKPMSLIERKAIFGAGGGISAPVY